MALSSTMRLNPHFTPAAQAMLGQIEREHDAHMRQATLAVANGHAQWKTICMDQLDKAEKAYALYATYFFAQFPTYKEFQTYVESNEGLLAKADPTEIETKILRDCVTEYRHLPLREKDNPAKFHERFGRHYRQFIESVTVNP